MKKLALLYVFYLLSALCNAQSGTLDPTFNSTDIGNGNGDGATGGAVFCSIAQPDGKILIGGSFKKHNQTDRNSLARLNSDGSLDLNFQGLNSIFPEYDFINSICLDSNGKIIITGHIGINPTSYIIRLNSDGTKDTFNEGNGQGANYDVSSAIVQPDGKIIIVGDFTSYNGVNRNCIARLNSDGTLDTSFDPGNGAMFGITTNSYYKTNIKNVQLQEDGKIIIVGNFKAYNGVARSHIARLNSDGSLDSSFDPGIGFGVENSSYFPINSIAIQPDGKIIVGGSFNSYNGASAKALVRINSNGSIDTSFNTGTGFVLFGTYISGNVYEYVGEIKTTALQPDGKIIVGGIFVKYNGTAIRNITRLNANGTLDTSFDVGTGTYSSKLSYGAPVGHVYSINILSETKIILGGDFTSYNNRICGAFARINSNGVFDLTFNPVTGANSYVKCSSIQPDGKIIIGGGFTNYNGVDCKGLVRLNTDGTVDSSFNIGTGFLYYNIPGTILSLYLQSDGKIIVAGGFTSFNGITKNNIVRLNVNGSLDATFNTDIVINKVWQTIILPDGKILVVNGNLIRLNQNGSQDIGFTPLTINSGYSEVKPIALQPDGKIIICDNNGVRRININGTIDSSFNSAGRSPIGYITCVNIQADGKIIIASRFSTSYINISRLNSDGTQDYSFYPSYPSVNMESINALKIQTDGKILIGGGFGGRVSESTLLRLNIDGAIDSSFNPDGAGPSVTGGYGAAIYDINLQSDNKIIIGGDFTAYNGTGRNRIARLFNTDNLATTDYTISPELKIYPNPTRDFLNLGNTVGVSIKSITIYNTLGQLVLAIPDAQKVKIVDVSVLVNGTYFMKINSDKGAVSRKFVKE